MADIPFLKSNQAIDAAVAVVIVFLVCFLVFRHWKSDPVGEGANRELGIDRLIEQVKNDLERVDRQRIAENKAALFKISTFDLEINFVIKETTSNEAGVKYQVVTVGGKNEVSAEKVQKIMLHMNAIDYSAGQTQTILGQDKPTRVNRSEGTPDQK